MLSIIENAPLFLDAEKIILSGQNTLCGTILHAVVNTGDLNSVKCLVKNVHPDIRPQLLQAKNMFGSTAVSACEVAPHEISHFLHWAEKVPPDMYLLCSKPVLLAICSTDKRIGADQELDSILKLSDIFDILVLKDPTENEVMMKLREIQFRPELSALTVVVMAHGMKDCFKVRDGFLTFKQLSLQMTPQFLANVPKVRNNINVAVLKQSFDVDLLVF